MSTPDPASEHTVTWKTVLVVVHRRRFTRAQLATAADTSVDLLTDEHIDPDAFHEGINILFATEEAAGSTEILDDETSAVRSLEEIDPPLADPADTSPGNPRRTAAPSPSHPTSTTATSPACTDPATPTVPSDQLATLAGPTSDQPHPTDGQ
jgi:hypothetical protein